MYNQQVMCTGDCTGDCTVWPVVYSLHGYIYYSSPTTGRARYCRLRTVETRREGYRCQFNCYCSDLTSPPLTSINAQHNEPALVPACCSTARTSQSACVCLVVKDPVSTDCFYQKSNFSSMKHPAVAPGEE